MESCRSWEKKKKKKKSHKTHLLPHLLPLPLLHLPLLLLLLPPSSTRSSAAFSKTPSNVSTATPSPLLPNLSLTSPCPSMHRKDTIRMEQQQEEEQEMGKA